MINKYSLFFSFIFLSLSSSAFATPTLACPEFPFFQPQTGPLAVINCDFHHSYEDRVLQIKNTFGAINGRPVILNLGGNLIFKYNGKREEIEITPLPYHQIKTFGHAVFSGFLILSKIPPGKLNAETISHLEKLKIDLQNAMAILMTLEISPEAKTLIQQLNDSTLAFLQPILQTKEWRTSDLDHYYQPMRPLLAKLLIMVSEIELNTLDQTVTRWLNLLTATERQALGIVIATAHQARAEEISSLYFAKKFGFQYGEGASKENGFVVIEDKFDEDSALKALARHYLDREAAQVIFNDATYLQRDLLSDAAKEILQRGNVPKFAHR